MEGHFQALESVKPYCPEQNIPQSVKRDCMKIEQLKWKPVFNEDLTHIRKMFKT